MVYIFMKFNNKTLFNITFLLVTQSGYNKYLIIL